MLKAIDAEGQLFFFFFFFGGGADSMCKLPNIFKAQGTKYFLSRNRHGIMGGGGGISNSPPPPFFPPLSAQMLVMIMITVPLPHYLNFATIFTGQK